MASRTTCCWMCRGKNTSAPGFPCMRQGAPVHQAQETTAPKALQIPPEPPIVHPGLLTLPPQGPLAFGHRANGLIADEGFRVPNGVMNEETELRGIDRVAGHRFLLHQQQSIQGRSEEPMYTLCLTLWGGYSLP